MSHRIDQRAASKPTRVQHVAVREEGSSEVDYVVPLRQER
jgi:hypothetical protein